MTGGGGGTCSDGGGGGGGGRGKKYIAVLVKVTVVEDEFDQ